MPSLNRKDGYLEVDHTFSPGLPEDVARAAGYDPKLCREGRRFEAATMHCPHCGVVLIKNPDRTRAREYCKLCDHYICDLCHVVRSQADYVHLPYKKFQDMVLSLASKGETVGSPQELLQFPTIIVP